MRTKTDWAVSVYSGPETLACPSEWYARSLERQLWLAAPRLPQRFQPTPAIAEIRLLLRHRRVSSTIADRLREGQIQTRLASVGILWCGMLKYFGQSLPKQKQAEVQPKGGSGNSSNCIFLSSLTGIHLRLHGPRLVAL
jgi:hypothetical protein